MDPNFKPHEGELLAAFRDCWKIERVTSESFVSTETLKPTDYETLGYTAEQETAQQFKKRAGDKLGQFRVMACKGIVADGRIFTFEEVVPLTPDKADEALAKAALVGLTPSQLTYVHKEMLLIAKENQSE
ncbi:MAG: hypothetical protein WCJ29_00720 [bacterium]